MLKQISVAAIVFGMSASIALGAGAFPYTFADYEADYQHTQGSMYTAAHGWAEPGQVWDMCRFPKNRDACADLNSREHIVNATVNEVASYGTRETNGVATYVQGPFITNAGNAVHIAKRARVGLPTIANGLDALLLRNPAMLDSHVDALVAHGGHRCGAVGEGPDLRGHLGDGGGVVVSQVLEDVTRKTSRQLGACVARPNDRIEGVLVPLQDLVRHAVPPAFPSD